MNDRVRMLATALLGVAGLALVLRPEAPPVGSDVLLTDLSVLDGLIAACGAADPVARTRAVKAIGALGPGARRAVPAVARAAADADPQLAREAAAALVRLRPDAQQTRELLALAWDVKSPPSMASIAPGLDARAAFGFLRPLAGGEATRKRAIRWMGGLRPVPSEACPVFAAAMRDAELEVVHAAILGIGRGCRDGACVDALGERLRGDDSWTGSKCAEALAAMGPAAARARPALLDAMTRGDDGLAADAAEAFIAVGGDRAVAAATLVRGRRGKRRTEAWATCRALVKIGVASDEVVEALRVIEQGADPTDRNTAARALQLLRQGS